MSRLALVTGGNRGIGFAIARGLARQGDHVLLGSRDPAKGEAAARELAADGQVTAVALDVVDPASITALAARIRADFGRCDVLINNAAIYLDEGVPLLEADLDDARAMFEANVLGPLQLCQALVPLMREHSYGRVVNLSSGSGQFAEMSGLAPMYGVSKAALNAFSHTLAKQLSGTNIKVNSMCPGWVRTDMGGWNATLSPDEGADTAIWLANLPDDGPSGGFFRARQPIPW